MKLLTTLIIFYFIYSFGFDSTIKNNDCLNKVILKNQIDTIKLKVKLINMVMLPEGVKQLSYLENKKLLKASDFYSSIRFKVLKCKEEYTFVCKDTSNQAMKILNSTYPIKSTLTCVIFNDKNILGQKNGEPFYTIIKVE